VTALLDNKLRSLRNSSVDSDKDEKPVESAAGAAAAQNLNSNPRLTVVSKMTHLQHPVARPLTLGENIPFADESPERPLIQARVKPIRHTTSNSTNDKPKSDLILEQQSNARDKTNSSKLSLTSSDETDSSTTSNHRERMRTVIRLEDSVLRKVNR